MTCREFAGFLLSYVDGELAQAARAAFDRHLAICPDCVAYLTQYRDTIAAARQAFAEDRVDAVPDDLLNAVLAGRRAAARE